MSDIRRNAVGGRFYTAQPDRLAAEIAGYLGHHERRPALGVISPHAGIMFSGRTAGEVLGRVEVPQTAVILCPNHTGMGRTDAAGRMWSQGAWEMPWGTVTVDEEIARALLERTDALAHDPEAHLHEHAVEVILPFLYQSNPQVQIVPIVMNNAYYDHYVEIGRALAETTRTHPGRILIVASSNMSHFETARRAKEKDMLALERVRALDPRGLLETTHHHRISMCGAIPSAVMLLAAGELGARRAELVSYTNSGMVTGDESDVVAYAGVIID